MHINCKNFRLKKGVTILFLLSTLTVFGQGNQAISKYWLTTGYGFNTVPGYSFYIGANVKVEPHLITLRYIANAEKIKSPNIVKDQLINCSEVGALYGRSWHVPFGFIAVSAGVSGTFGTKRGELIFRDQSWWPLVYEWYNYSKFFTPGISLEGTAVFSPIDWVSAGITLFANINAKIPFAGIAFVGTLGRVRE